MSELTNITVIDNNTVINSNIYTTNLQTNDLAKTVITVVSPIVKVTSSQQYTNDNPNYQTGIDGGTF
jgi:hypothetical protein